ncbi:MAG: double zinc ribbon domain-containing protein [Nitrospirota bacterium]
MYRLLILQILAGIAGGIIANKKGRNYAIWSILCFIFPALILIVLILPPLLTKGRTKRCANCAGIISEDETVCRYCVKEQPISLRRCRECGSFVPDKEYCSNCNKKLQE